MAERFRVRAEDRREAERLKMRVELARLQRELPERREELNRIEETILHIRLRRALDDWQQERDAIDRLGEEIDALQSEQRKWKAKVVHMERLRADLQTVQDIHRDYKQELDLEAEILNLEEKIARLDRLQNEQLPALIHREETLLQLSKRLEHVREMKEKCADAQKESTEVAERIQAAEKALEDLSASRDRVHQLEAALQKARTDLQQMEHLRQRVRIREAIVQWKTAREGIEAPEQKHKALIDAQATQKALKQGMRRKLVKIGAGAFSGLLLLSAAMLSGLLPYPVIGGLAVVLLLVVAQRVVRMKSKLKAVSSEISRLEGERRAYQSQVNRYKEAMEKAENHLLSLNATVPVSVEDAQRTLAELNEHLRDYSPRDIEEKVEAIRGDVARLEARYEQAVQTVQQLESEIASVDISLMKKRLDSLNEKVAGYKRDLQELQGHVRALADVVGLEPDDGAVRGYLGRTQAEIERIRHEIAERDNLADILQRIRKNQEALWWKIEKSYSDLYAAHPRDLPPWSREKAESVLRTATQSLQVSYGSIMEEQPRENLDRVQHEIGMKKGEQETRRQRSQSLYEEEVLSVLSQLGISVTESLEENLKLAYGIAGDAPIDREDALRAKIDEIKRRIGFLQQRQNQLEEELGLKGMVIDLEKAEQESEAKNRELAVREKAREIVQKAQRRVVERVLPATMEQMRVLLPVLTMERYFDAELTDDYRIRVWDERARDWKRKTIFSGGTRDQLSLALRLAFALATLPSEHGSAPAFIFLDEPLSSFDSERARALLHLLTEGEIAQSFDQIFLTSHVRVDTALFNYHILMEDGRVAETDLPTGA